MVLGKFTDAMADLSETLRRVFQSPPSHALDPRLAEPRSRGVATLAVEARPAPYELGAVIVAVRTEVQAASVAASMLFEGRIQAEEGLARWAAGARVCEMPVFATGGQRRVEVPALPRRALCRCIEREAFRTSSRSVQDPFRRPALRSASLMLNPGGVRSGLELALGLPIAVQGQDVQTLPKAQWMRFSLQLVKATGENIRNLEVLGLYRIPSRGVGGMRHDPKSGRLFLELGREAAGAPRQPFILARRKDDRTLVSCFLEEA